MKPETMPMPPRDPADAKHEGNEHQDDGKVRDAMKGGMGKGAKPCPNA